jgi:hypothetical protein
MGYSYSSDEGPVMCFNGPKNWQLGWYADRHIDVLDNGSWTGNVYGLSAYSASSPGDAIVVRISASPNIYVSYNRKDGINSGTVEGGDQLLVHTKAAATYQYGESTLVAKLSSGDFATVSDNTIRFLSSGGDYAVVQIGDSQPNPTPPPTPSPTNAPNPNPTTPSPTANCVDDKKICDWFGSKTSRCYKKAGALDGCPSSCEICDLTAAEICENAGMNGAACKNASMCSWKWSTRTCSAA